MRQKRVKTLRRMLKINKVEATKLLFRRLKKHVGRGRRLANCL